MPSPRQRSMHAFFLSFGVIFVAELGDKSQLMALTFATRYRALPILIGITIATAARARRVRGHRRSARCRAADANDLDHRRPGVLRLRGMDIARRHARRRRGLARATHEPILRSSRVGCVLPRRARRQDDAGDDHAGDDRRAARRLGRARRSGMVTADALAILRRSADGHAVARAGDPDRGESSRSSCSASSSLVEGIRG